MAWAEKLPSGRWRAVYRDARGARRSAGTFTHKPKAERAAAVAEDKARRSLAGDPDAGKRPWGEWADEWWLVRQVEPQTAITDLGRRRNHLDPQWADVPIGAIRRHDVNAWVSIMRRNGTGEGTIAQAVRLLSASLTAAIDAEIIDSNPASRIKLPPAAAAVERYLTREEYDAVTAQLPTSLDVAIADWLANTGLRFGELAGLHRERFEPGRQQIRVVETFEEKVGTIKLYPKGRRVRDVPVPLWLVRDTLELLDGDESPARCGLVHRGGGRCRSGLLLTGPRGGVLRSTNWLERVWQPAVVRAGVDHCRVHDLRHTYASWLLQDGVPLARVGQLLGHVSPVTTQRYAHLQPGDNEQVLAALPAPRLPHAADLEAG